MESKNSTFVSKRRLCQQFFVSTPDQTEQNGLNKHVWSHFWLKKAKDKYAKFSEIKQKFLRKL